jgi:lysophospholipase L1-like esterase
VVNAAIGGSTTGKGRQWMLRDVAGVRADLVTIMFGYNEQPSAGDVAGSSREWMGRMVTYLEEVAGTMDRPPACVMLATIPGRDEHWQTLDPYAQAVRDFAAGHPNVTVADVNAHFKAMGKEAYQPLMGDEAHPNDAGQMEMAKVVFEAMAGQEE